MNNTMLRRVMCLLWLCLAYLPAHAQTETPSSSMDSLPTRYKWEVATDLLWLIDKNTMPATSVFIRRHTKKGAFRASLGYSFKRNFEDFTPPPPVPSNPDFHWQNESENISLYFLKAGYQRTKKLANVHIYYGADLFWTLQKTIGEKYYIEYKGYYDFSEKTERRVGIHAFVGVQKYFWKRFSVSAEVTLSGYTEYYAFLRTTYEYPEDDPDTGAWAYITYRRKNIQLIPLGVLNFSYHF